MRKGYHLSEETKQKISNALAGKKNLLVSLARKGKSRPEFSAIWKKRLGDAKRGKKLSEEHKAKIGLANRGKRNGSWSGGVTPENMIIRHSPKYVSWREAVFSRDNWVCQK